MTGFLAVMSRVIEKLDGNRLNAYTKGKLASDLEKAKAEATELLEGYRAALDALDEIAHTTDRSLVIGAETYSASGHAECVRIANEAIDSEKFNAALQAPTP